MTQSLADGFHLGVATDEARESAHARCLQACTREFGASQLEDLDRLAEPLHWDRPARHYLHEALGKREGLRRQ